MFIGASPGSTGGGIKTSTFFVILQGIKSAATNQSERAFHYAIPTGAFRKAVVITLLSLSVVIVGTFLMLVLEPVSYTHLDVYKRQVMYVPLPLAFILSYSWQGSHRREPCQTYA